MKRDIEIRTDDGVAKAGLFQAEGGSAAKAGVILYMDAFGPRPALDQMAERLASEGYAVLVPDLFYRNGAYGPFDAKTAFTEDKKRAEIMALIGGTTPEMTARTRRLYRCPVRRQACRARSAPSAIAWAAAAPSTPPPPIPKLRRGRQLPRRQSGKRCARQPAPSCRNHQGPRLCRRRRRRPQLPAGTVGAAGRGVANAPRSTTSSRTMSAWQHGWTVPDHGIYDEAGAERHWKRLTTFFGETLG